MRTRLTVSLALLTLACSSPHPADEAPLSLRTESGEPLSTVPAVDRFYLRGGPQLGGGEELQGKDIWLVEGEVSQASQGKLRAGDAPESVERARVPLVTWSGEGDVELTLAPSRPLEPGQRYSWIALGYGLIATMDVAEEERPLLVRWGEGPVRPLDLVPYCRVAPPQYVEGAEESFPELTTGDLPLGTFGGLDSTGLASDLCVRVLIDSIAPGFFVPPPSIGEALMDPTPLVISGESNAPDPKNEPICDPLSAGKEGQVSIEEGGTTRSIGCLWPEPALLGMRLAPGDYFITVQDAEGSRRADGAASDQNKVFLRALLRSSGEDLRLGPVAPDSTLKVHVMLLRSGSSSQAKSITIQAAPPLPRFVLLEVLADPLGPEPASEWVEIGNVGTAPGSLAGYEIWDEVGGAVLPDQVLLPGESGVIVRTDYVPGVDVLPDPGAVPLWVPEIGGNGLRNSGETVELLDAQGAVVSSIPGQATKEGVSLARVGPWLADLPQSFAPHAEPGCSPGSANSFQTESD